MNEGKKTVEKTVEETVEKILNAIEENPKITAKEIQGITGLSRRGVEYQLDKLKKEKLIERIGPDRGGEWRILNRK
jgi:ATP-dependent DNA helicase RecG